MIKPPNPDEPNSVSEMQFLRFGGGALMDDVKTFTRCCEEIKQKPSMLLGIAISHRLHSISEGMLRDEIATEMANWLEEECLPLIESGASQDMVTLTCSMVGEATAAILFSIHEIMENGNLTPNTNGRDFAYELVKLSPSGTLVIGRSSGSY